MKPPHAKCTSKHRCRLCRKHFWPGVRLCVCARLCFALLPRHTSRVCALRPIVAVRGTPETKRGKVDQGLVRRPGTNRFILVRRGGEATRTNYTAVVHDYQCPSLDRHWVLPPPKVASAEKDSKNSQPALAKPADPMKTHLSLLVLRASTHHRHQLRAVCSLLGTPIVGDRDYGGGDLKNSTLTLIHNALIDFPSLDGLSKYSIVHPPRAWAAMGLPDLTALVVWQRLCGHAFLIAHLTLHVCYFYLCVCFDPHVLLSGG